MYHDSGRKQFLFFEYGSDRSITDNMDVKDLAHHSPHFLAADAQIMYGYKL